MKITKLNFSVFLLLILMVSCKRESIGISDGDSLINNYKSVVIKNIVSNISSFKSGSTTFPNIEASDFNSTLQSRQSDPAGGELTSFVTPINRNNEFAAAVVGYRTKNNNYLNVVYVPYNVSSDRKGVDVYYLNGTRIGYFEIENDVVVETGMANENNDGQTTSNLAAATSWWACTRECISDAHIACYGDSQCMTLLLISNAPSGTGASGLGSASIAIACGAVCAKNRETDLIVD